MTTAYAGSSSLPRQQQQQQQQPLRMMNRQQQQSGSNDFQPPRPQAPAPHRSNEQAIAIDDKRELAQ
jgi:hypothetical protein